MKYYVVNGRAGSGKTSFEELAMKYADAPSMNVSTIDFVKQVAYMCGWDGTKTPHNRKFLSDLKDLLTNWEDVPYKMVEKSILEFKRGLMERNYDSTNAIVFMDCREPVEIDKLKSRLGAKTVFIDRKIDSYEPSNHADAEVENYEYDIIIDNNGDLHDLRLAVANFLKQQNIPEIK